MAKDNGTTILSSDKRFQFSWDHGKHHYCLTHLDSILPSFSLFRGTGCFSAFCLQVESIYSDRVRFAFSSAYSLKPSNNVVSDDESNAESNSKDDEEWFSPGSPAKDGLETTRMDHPHGSFELGMSLSYYDGKGLAEIVVEPCQMVF